MVAVARPLPTRAPVGRPSERPVRAAPGAERSRPAPSAAVYRRRRMAAAVVVVALMAGALAVGAGAASLLAGGAAPAPSARALDASDDGSRAVVGAPGDTVWGIARALHAGGDVRATVDRIVAANGGSATLRVGQRLVLPPP